MFHVKPGWACVSLAALALGGCSGPAEQAPEAPAPAFTVVTTVEAPPVADAEVPEAEVPTAVAPKASAPTSTRAVATAPSIAERNLVAGQQVDAFGQTATFCTSGDGAGISALAVGPNTTCEFALVTANVLMNQLVPTHDTIRAGLPATVTAHSPATGQDYRMTCSMDSNRLVTCRGGNNAAVYMY